jgi:uncharacterized phiE125 gp8 family phage protein
MIKFNRVSEPEEPLLTIDEPIKDQYLRVDFDFEDDYIKHLLTSVVLMLEKELRMPLFRADYNMIINLTNRKEYDYPKVDPFFDFRNIKVNNIDSMITIDMFGKETVCEVNKDYIYKDYINRLYFPTMKNLASYGIDHVVFECNLGFTKNNLPEDLRTALYGLVAYYYQNRAANAPMPFEILNSVASYKRWY